MNMKERLEAARRELEAAQAAYEEECKEWEPEGGRYVVAYNGEIVGVRGKESNRAFGTTRPTRQLAEQTRDSMRIHNRALAYVHEHAPEWDGSDPFSVYWSNLQKRWVIFREHNGYAPVGAVVGPENVMQQLADDLNSGRVKL